MSSASSPSGQTAIVPVATTGVATTGAAYAAQARAHWSRWRPSEVAAMTDPGAFFADLGLQAAEQIEETASRSAGPDVPGETYLQKLGRLRMAQFTAQQQVLRDLLLPEPETSLEQSLDEQNPVPTLLAWTDPASHDPGEWLPTVLTPEHPRYRDLDGDPGLSRP